MATQTEPRPTERISITFERGLNQGLEESMLPDGAAGTLLNWEPSPTGELRGRAGWSKGSTTSAPSTRKGIGIGHVSRQRRPYQVQKASASNFGTDPVTATATWPATTIAGNLLVLKIGFRSTGSLSPEQAQFVLTVPGGWTRAIEMPQGNISTTRYSAIYYKANASAESGTVAVTYEDTAIAATVDLVIEISEVANIKTTSPVIDFGGLSHSGGTSLTATTLGRVHCQSASSASEAVLTREAHPFVVNDKVRFIAGIGGTGALPSGLSEGTDYYVVTVDDTTHFSVSLTLGGSEVNIDGAGTEPFYAGYADGASTAPVRYNTSMAILANTAGQADTYSAPSNDFVEDSDIFVDNGINDLMFGSWHSISTAPGIISHTATSVDAFGGAYEGSLIVSFEGANYTQSDGFFFVAQDDTTEIDIFYIDQENLSSGTWKALETVTGAFTSTPVAFTRGLGVLFYSHPGWTHAHKWEGLDTAATAITQAPAGRAVAFHKNRGWIAGTNGSPTRLYFSEIGDIDIWNALDFIDIAKDDGEVIEDITPQQDVLMIGKRTGLWALSGTGLDNFVLQKLPVGGLAPGRTLTPTPYGTVCAGRNSIWLVNGLEVNKISLPVNSMRYTSGFFTGSFIDDKYYLCNSATGDVWVLNMQTGTWYQEAVDGAGTEEPAVIYNFDQTQVFAPKAATIGGLLNYRVFPTLSPRTKDFDTLAHVYSAQTGLIFPVGPEEAFTPRHLYMRIRQHAGGTGDSMTVTPRYRLQGGTTVNGTVHSIAAKSAASVFRERIDLGNKLGVSGVRFDFDYTVSNGKAGVMDIEEITFEYDVERTR